MAISKTSCLFFLLICSLAFVGFSQGDGNNGPNSMPCVEKLLPCQAYLKGSASPPRSCCVPLKEIVANDSECLCAVFNNPVIMKSLNVTQEDALNLAKSCGANADTSICKAGSPPTPTTPSSPSNTSSAAAAAAAAADSQKKSAAGTKAVISYLSLAAIFTSVILYLF
ncbi:hypothetical protein RD792_006119 [Penstemon davidsonii]|uniref:Bifunctional inhibitor/plant lipid transfer protein/seed storage helical domain-containing protein n=1 Tax=Penstemon davidsonii TaxID=160366 RepID=A0ABR0DE13_9LAMI|nr:hypothetical protein RD792_006119 [Penstemon davidsonii]